MVDEVLDHTGGLDGVQSLLVEHDGHLGKQRPKAPSESISFLPPTQRGPCHFPGHHHHQTAPWPYDKELVPRIDRGGHMRGSSTKSKATLQRVPPRPSGTMSLSLRTPKEEFQGRVSGTVGRNTCELGSSCCGGWGWRWQTRYPLGLPYKTPENLIH